MNLNRTTIDAISELGQTEVRWAIAHEGKVIGTIAEIVGIPTGTEGRFICRLSDGRHYHGKARGDVLDWLKHQN